MLLRAKLEQPQPILKPKPAAPADNAGKSMISDLIDRWKSGQRGRRSRV